MTYSFISKNTIKKIILTLLFLFCCSSLFALPGTKYSNSRFGLLRISEEASTDIGLVNIGLEASSDYLFALCQEVSLSQGFNLIDSDSDILNIGIYESFALINKSDSYNNSYISISNNNVIYIDNSSVSIDDVNFLFTFGPRFHYAHYFGVSNSQGLTISLKIPVVSALNGDKTIQQFFGYENFEKFFFMSLLTNAFSIGYSYKF